MVDGRHFEDALAPQLVGPDLQDHRERLNYEHATDEGQEKFLFDDNGYGAEHRRWSDWSDFIGLLSSKKQIVLIDDEIRRDVPAMHSRI